MKRAFYYSIILMSAAALTVSCGQEIPESISDEQGEVRPMAMQGKERGHHFDALNASKLLDLLGFALFYSP